jgi:K(+)-stimulated pyrophosphate-energized sodium pump
MTRWSSRAAGASATLLAALFTPAALAGEAELVLPDLGSVRFLGVGGASLLLVGIAVSAAGLIFGLVISRRLGRIEHARRHA